MRKMPSLFAALVVAALPAAAAAQPVDPIAPPLRLYTGPVEIPDGVQMCGFRVQIEEIGKQGTVGIPTDSSMIIFNVGTHVTVTNLDDPSKAVTLNFAGTSRWTYHPDTNDYWLELSGRAVYAGAPWPGLVLAIGEYSVASRWDLGSAEPTVTKPFSGTGMLVNLCDLIR